MPQKRFFIRGFGRTRVVNTASGNQDLQSQAREVLLEHSEELMSCIKKNPSESQSSTDESIDLFTSRLADLMRPCFEISKVTPKVGQVSKIPRVHSGVNSMNKPWFHEELKEIPYISLKTKKTNYNSWKPKRTVRSRKLS